jgi:hypothetical protein
MSLGGADEGGHGWIEKVMEVGCGRKGSMHGSCMLVVEKDIIAGSFGGIRKYNRLYVSPKLSKISKVA